MVFVLEGKSAFFPYKCFHSLTLSATLGLWDGEGRKTMLLYCNDGFFFDIVGEWQVQINDVGMERKWMFIRKQRRRTGI
jgi:hypothetical protein